MSAGDGEGRIGQAEALRSRTVAVTLEAGERLVDRRELVLEVRVRVREVRNRERPLETLDRLEERLRERPPETERLADRLHLRPEDMRRAELLEVEARRLDRDVVQGRLERRGALPGDVVRQLVERVADREQRRQLRDRKARRLRRERRRPRDARVHLDERELPRRVVVGELHVRPSRRDAHRPRAQECRVAQPLVLGIRQGLLRGDGPRVACVDAHRVDVLDRADDHAVARGVAHHLELELRPAPQRALDEHLRDRAHLEAVRDDALQLRGRLGDPAALAAERERGPYDRRNRTVAELRERRDDHALGHRETRRRDHLAEELPILGAADRLEVRADQLDAVALEDARLRELHREVERRLAAERRQERVGPLARDDLLHRLGVERLDVGRVRPLGVGHDRRRVRVHEHDPVTLRAQHAAGLGAGVVELRGLSDPDRPGADDEDRL